MRFAFWLFWLSYQYYLPSDWIEKTPLKKPNCGEGIVSKKPRQKSVMIVLVYCIGSLFYYVFVLSPAPT